MLNKFKLALIMGAVCFAQACANDTAETHSSEPQKTVATAANAQTDYDAPASAWRDVDPENLILIDTAYGVIGVELYPEIAPLHTDRIKALARSKFYDNVPFHRVIDGFMNQTGDGSNGDGTGDSDLPDLQAEFTFRRTSNMPVTLIGARQNGQNAIDVGYYKAMPIASQPIVQASETSDGNVGAFGLHCKGVTSMARTNDPNSANSQFFLMRAKAEHLDSQYTIWGNTVLGFEHLEKPTVGAVGQNSDFVPDQMNNVRVAADIPENERPKVQVMKTSSPAFSNYLKTKKNADGVYPDICDITVPSRTL
ncbi:MAG: peptidylprolyl isomerase [Litorimonas sp.]